MNHTLQSDIYGINQYSLCMFVTLVVHMNFFACVLVQQSKPLQSYC